MRVVDDDIECPNTTTYNPAFESVKRLRKQNNVLVAAQRLSHSSSSTVMGFGEGRRGCNAATTFHAVTTTGRTKISTRSI